MTSSAINESTVSIACPECGARYRLAQALLEKGRFVRCKRCSSSWFAQLGGPELELSDSFVDHDSDVFAQASLPQEAVDNSAADSFESSALSPQEVSVQTYEPALTDDGGPVVAPDVTTRRPIPSRSWRKQVTRTPLRTSVLVSWIVFSLLALLVLFREPVVRFVPESARLFSIVGLDVNLRGLEFRDVKVTFFREGNERLLGVEGLIVNMVAERRDVPRVRVAVLDRAGQPVMSWTVSPTQDSVNPRAAVTFRSRMAGLPETAEQVEVRFLNKRDVITGLPR